MRVLTIKQPWASLIINEYKRYEFRSWKTNYRGKILIHAGLSCEKKNIIMFDKYNLEYTYGAIIGEADIVDCIPIDSNFNKCLLDSNPLVYGNRDRSMGYAWKLDNIIKYDKPIFCKGKLGLWNYHV